MNSSGKSKHRWPLVLLVLALAGMGLGVFWIFQLSFRPGAVYPPYSTLRSDPLGSKLFYHSLGQLEARKPARSHLPLTQLDTGTSPGVLFFLGIKQKDLENASVAEAEVLEKMIKSGWRIVFTLEPEKAAEEKKEPGGAEKAAEKLFQPDTKNNKEKPPLDYYPDRKVLKARRERHLESSYFKPASLLNRWDLQLEAITFTGSKGQHPDEVTDHLITAEPVAGSGLTEGFPFFSETVVKLHSKEWLPVFLREGKPVVVERKWGKGSLVFIADSYAFSNQALAQNPSLALLEWCLDGRSVVVFDESHHGIQSSPGVMTMARQLRLEGLFAGLLVLSLLLVWRASRSFPPLPSTENESGEREETSSPRDQLDGLANLLQRGLPAPDLVQACLKEWRLAGHGRELDEIPGAADEIPRQSNPSAILHDFNRLHKHLNQKIRV